jgi:hypothetical protein
MSILFDITPYCPLSVQLTWRRSENTNKFRYSVGVEFLQLQKNFGLKASLPIAPRMKTENMRRDEAVIEMGKS